MYSTRTFDFGLRWTFFKIDKTSDQVSAVTKVSVSLVLLNTKRRSLASDIQFSFTSVLG